LATIENVSQTTISSLAFLQEGTVAFTGGTSTFNNSTANYFIESKNIEIDGDLTISRGNANIFRSSVADSSLKISEAAKVNIQTTTTAIESTANRLE